MISVLYIRWCTVVPCTDSTPPRKDTGLFESFGRFIGLKCRIYALYLCFAYIYICLCMCIFIYIYCTTDEGDRVAENSGCIYSQYINSELSFTCTFVSTHFYVLA